MKSIVRFAFFALPLMGVALSGAASSPCYTPDCCDDATICCPDGEVCVATSAESVPPVVSLAAVAAAAASTATMETAATASLASSGGCGPCPIECCD